jgi:hypothetical protein
MHFQVSSRGFYSRYTISVGAMVALYFSWRLKLHLIAKVGLTGTVGLYTSPVT